MAVGVVGIIYLIAHAPEKYRGMVAVAAHHIADIAVDPLLEEVVASLELRSAGVPSRYPFAFGIFPLVAPFVHHQQPEFVAKVVDHGSLRVVAHADGVDAQFLEIFKAGAPESLWHGCAETAHIVVKAYTLHLHVSAVERETAVGAEFQATHTKRHLG